MKRPREEDSDGEKSDSELQVVVDDDNTDPVSPAGSSPSSTYDRERHHQSVKRERPSTPSSVKSGSVSYFNIFRDLVRERRERQREGGGRVGRDWGC